VGRLSAAAMALLDAPAPDLPPEELSVELSVRRVLCRRMWLGMIDFTLFS
jgi:hypothetical protein